MGYLSAPPPPLVRRRRRPGPCEPLSETDWIGGGEGRGSHRHRLSSSFPPRRRANGKKRVRYPLLPDSPSLKKGEIFFVALFPYLTILHIVTYVEERVRE